MKEKILFLIVGALNTLIGYGLFSALILSLSNILHYMIIAVISHFIAVTISFVTHRRFVFHSKSPIIPTFLRFTISSCTSLTLGLVLMGFLVEFFAQSPIVAQGIVITISTAISYTLHRHYSFSAHP